MQNTEKKKIVVYANYYYPEVASLSQICTDLCTGLQKKFDVTVICAVPCYTGVIEEKYKKKKYYFEEYDGVKVIRVRVPFFDKKNKMSRVKHILGYFFRAMSATFKAPKADYVFTVSQPPVLGGMLGVFGKRVNRLRGKKTKLIYNIQDYNPEQTIAVGYSKNKIALHAMAFLDKRTCKKADKVIVVGRDMAETMQKRFTAKSGKLQKSMPKTAIINNWMDEREVYPLPDNDEKVIAFKKKYGLENKFVVMYSGNIGLFYDLEKLIEVIEQFKNDSSVVFPFVGEGVLKSRLEEYVKEHNLKNVIFIPYQPKEELIYSLNAASVHWVVNAKGIKGVSVPSKLYGVMAAGKPVLGVLEEGSEARMIVEETGCGLVAAPCDYEKIAKLLKKFITKEVDIAGMGASGRAYLEKNLTKDVSLEKYVKEIEEC